MGWLRVAFLAYQNRSLLLRTLFVAVVIAVAIPVLFVVALFGAFGALGAGPPAGSVDGAVKPMSTWVVTQEFGCTGILLEPAYGGCRHFHSGIDLATAAGAPVFAVLPGVAEVIHSAAGFGNHVLLHHSRDLITLYGHLLATSVVNGQAVPAGAVIGFEGSTGNSSGPHLHFEVRQGSTAVSPREAFPGIFLPGPRAQATTWEDKTWSTA